MKNNTLELEEPGLLISRQCSWIGASLDGIRKCQCCDPSVVEFKCPFTGKDLDPKIAFLLPSIGGKKIKRGSIFLMKITYIIFKFRLAWLFSSGFKTCDFVTYTSKGIFVVTVNFNAKFWETVVATVFKFYCKQIVPSFLLEAFHSYSNQTKQ